MHFQPQSHHNAPSLPAPLQARVSQLHPKRHRPESNSSDKETKSGCGQNETDGVCSPPELPEARPADAAAPASARAWSTRGSPLPGLAVTQGARGPAGCSGEWLFSWGGRGQRKPQASQSPAGSLLTRQGPGGVCVTRDSCKGHAGEPCCPAALTGDLEGLRLSPPIPVGPTLATRAPPPSLTRRTSDSG